MYQSDIARYLVVDTFGGLYLDTDITCFKCADEMLGTADVVLQASHNHEGLTNFALASVPAAGIWSTVLKIAQQRIAEDKQKNNPIDHTGPRALARASKKVTGIAPCFLNATCVANLTKSVEEHTVAADIVGTHHFKNTWHG